MEPISDKFISTITIDDMEKLLNSFAQKAMAGEDARLNETPLKDVQSLNEWYLKLADGYEFYKNRPDARSSRDPELAVENEGVELVYKLYPYVLIAIEPQRKETVQIPAELHYCLVTIISGMKFGPERKTWKVAREKLLAARAGTGDLIHE